MSIFNQSNNPLSTHRSHSLTNLCISLTLWIDDTQIIPIGTGHANLTPIRVTMPRLVKGTSTIQRRLLSGQHHFRTTLRCRHNVNPRTIKCQSVISMMPTTCQSNANPLTIRQSNFTRTMSKTPSANHEKNHHRWRVIRHALTKVTPIQGSILVTNSYLTWEQVY